MQKDITQVRPIVKASYRIAVSFSGLMCIFLFIWADNLATFVKVSHMTTAFRMLGFIIVFRAANTVGAGLLGGFKQYKQLGKNNVFSGVAMLILSVPMTLSFSLKGALFSLLFSQVLLTILNSLCVWRRCKIIPSTSGVHFEKRLVSFSFPFALNEFIYSTSSWGSALLLVRFSSVGELGISTACSQWESIILFMPGLLGNVILSYLSTTAYSNQEQHSIILKRMLLVNFVCTAIPLLVVLIFAPLVTDFYGATFIAMKPVLTVSILSTIFACMSRVFLANLTSEGKNWRAFAIRGSQHTIKIIAIYMVLKITNGLNAAYNCAWVGLVVSIITFLMYYADFSFSRRAKHLTKKNF